MCSDNPAFPSFEKLCELEPRLVDLAELVKTLAPTHATIFRCWYGDATTDGIKDVLVALVGYGAANPQLRNSESYDAAYDYLLGRLAKATRNSEEL
jgi:hypothetical protein